MTIDLFLGNMGTLLGSFMDSLFDIFIANIIDKEDVETRRTVVSQDLDNAENEILNSIADEDLKQKFDKFKRLLTEHYLCIREEDCSKVLAVAMKFNRLIDQELEKIRIEEIEDTSYLNELHD